MTSTMATYQKILRRLHEARLSLGLSQEDAGVLLGRNQTFISRCESGERRLTVIELIDFASAYQLNLALLLSNLKEDDHA